jgi:hypothetical protein
VSARASASEASASEASKKKKGDALAGRNMKCSFEGRERTRGASEKKK